MVRAVIYVEGGGSGADSKELHVRCREAFRRLLESCGFKGRLPRLVACGGREATFDDFKAGVAGKTGDYVAMWIDSEEPLADFEAAWAHLSRRDGWERPAGATDAQVFFMTTCMESLIVADRAALKAHYGSQLQETALPPVDNLEQRGRHDVQARLGHATRNCANAYAKGKRSFEILGKLAPATLEQHLPSFARARRILNASLPPAGRLK